MTKIKIFTPARLSGAGRANININFCPYAAIRRFMMNQTTLRHIYIIFVLALFFVFNAPGLALSGSKAVPTSKAVFYVY